jgi:hypothetical protein
MRIERNHWYAFSSEYDMLAPLIEVINGTLLQRGTYESF